MSLKALEVIWIHDECISPPGPKMVVCVESAHGFFFRINSRPNWQESVPLKKTKTSNIFLDHDSYLECGDPLELDDYVIDESIKDRGIIGTVDSAVIPVILKAVDAATRMSPNDKAAIRTFLDPTGAHAQLPGAARPAN